MSNVTICQAYYLSGLNIDTRCTNRVKWVIHCLPREWNKGYVCGHHVEHWALIGGAHPITQTYKDWKQQWDESRGGPTSPEQAYKEWYTAVHTLGGRVKRSVKGKLYADKRRSQASQTNRDK